MNALEVANMQLAAGNKLAAERTLYGNGLTWNDLSLYQQRRTKLQRPPPEHSLPPSLRGGLAGSQAKRGWNYVAPKFPIFRKEPVKAPPAGPIKPYHSPPIIPIRPTKVPKLFSLRGLADATLATAMPDDNSSIQDQLASIRIDWATGNLWVGNNKYSLVTTLIGGLVIKGMLFGGHHIAAMGKRLVGSKQVPAEVKA